MRRLLVLLIAMLLFVPALAGAAAACRTTTRCPLAVAAGHDCCARPQPSLKAGCCDADARSPASTPTGSERVQPSALPASSRPVEAPAQAVLAAAGAAAAHPLAALAAQRSVLRI